VVKTLTRGWALLARVPDPEIPAISVVDLGIVRSVDESPDGRAVHVVLTPTYSGCPATEVIRHDVRAALEATYEEVEIEVRLSPAWTTDWLSDAGRSALREHGIAPPAAAPIDLGASIPVGSPHEDNRPDSCPVCGAADLEELAPFGSTPCQALWRCRSCREPFGYFKRH
jgi:ring-1,2-phenylacetyl-CoA epoxidase subunit PaaD